MDMIFKGILRKSIVACFQKHSKDEKDCDCVLNKKCEQILSDIENSIIGRDGERKFQYELEKALKDGG